MKIEILRPSGFCYGVMHSYTTTLDLIKQYPHKKIYMLGWLVHNQSVIDELLALHVIILDDAKTTRYELINQFDHVIDSILILSAHGTELKTIELAKAKGFEVHDLTCKLVYKTHEVIKQKIAEDYDIVFIGKFNHPETNAILGINNKIKLVTQIDDIEKLDLRGDKIFCTNQTTFNNRTLNEIITSMQKTNSAIVFQNDICNATLIRQQAILKMSDQVDVCIIIGDQKSSNAKELYTLAKSKTQTYFIGNAKDLQDIWFANKQYCAIAAATSTPAFIIEMVYKTLVAKFTK